MASKRVKQRVRQQERPESALRTIVVGSISARTCLPTALLEPPPPPPPGLFIGLTKALARREDAVAAAAEPPPPPPPPLCVLPPPGDGTVLPGDSCDCSSTALPVLASDIDGRRAPLPTINSARHTHTRARARARQPVSARAQTKVVDYACAHHHRPSLSAAAAAVGARSAEHAQAMP
jgi:hypothetical protein